MSRRNAFKVFLLIVFLALLLRTAGLFTYDSKFLPSEVDIRLNTSYMWLNSTAQMKEYAYPSFYFYIAYSIQKVSYFVLKFLGITHSPTQFLFSRQYWDVLYTTGRLLSVFFTMMVFLILFLIGSQEFNPLVGLASSLFLAFPLIDVVNSRLAKPDSLLNFLIIFTVYLSVKYFREGKRVYLIFAAITSGLSISTKYFFIAGAPLFFAIILENTTLGKKIKNLLIAGLVGIFSFLLTCPYCVLDYKKVLVTFTGAQNFAKGFVVPVHHAYVQVFSDLLKYSGYGVFVAGVLGLVFAFLKDWKSNLIIFSFPAVYLIMLSITKVYGPRYLVYLFPYLSLYAGYLVVKIFKKPVIVLSISLILALPMLPLSLRAVHWFASERANREIMNDFIKNSLPDTKLAISYQAYKLDTTKYANFPRFAQHWRPPLFFVWGAIDDYYCSAGSRFLKWCGPLLKSLPKYWKVFSLPDPPVPYAIDFRMSLLRKRPTPGEVKFIFPIIPKLQGRGKILYPAIPYVRDMWTGEVKPSFSVEREYYYQGKGEICVLVRKLRNYGSYEVNLGGYKKRSHAKVFVECVKPGERYGRIYVKSLGSLLEVFFSSSPLNMGEIVLEYSPDVAEKYLKKISTERIYSFEANRLLYLLYKRKKELKKAEKVRDKISLQTNWLRLILQENFQRKYRAAGFDLGYIRLSQRIYPEFIKGRSRRFFVLPGVYILSRSFDGYIEMDGRPLSINENSIVVEKPGWARVILKGRDIPMGFFLYFSPKETLKWELDQILGGSP